MLKQRLITALVLIVVSLWALFGAEQLAWQVAVIFVSMIGAWEWAQFMRLDNRVMRFAFSVLTACLVGIGLYFEAHNWIVYLAVIQLIVVVVAVTRYQLSAGQAGLNNPFAAGLIGLLFLVSFALSLIWLREAYSAWVVLFSMAMIWVMDSGAYFAGRRFGRHKLAPHVSPGKTWEGVLGGVMLVGLMSVLVWFGWAQTFYSPGLVVFVLITSLIAALSVYGDLFESLLKRQVNIKDSGKILPGHGGVLDRIDSLLLALPLFWVFWSFT
ncbi:MAG: CDP-archaeol synthase [Thiomicrospira sp.]|uniref:phosphatidate cytidylyltransferase n=1 Tax=Thiomicrospira sp. TaxID=935 RepID=UPI0019E05689|nr:CDP-archaeol synthase [Thiomicrospira sp.]MBE0493237.1 CDP-archaeol synthase [Thiomicrospira sp.]